jgi:uncharacterized phage infection (PIP) family protein YhgE
MKRLSLLVLAIALLAGVSACGGGDELSKDDYRAELEGSQSALVESLGTLAASAQATPDVSSVADLEEFFGQLADQVEASVTALEEAADELDDVEPPGDAAEAHDKLVEGIRLLADDFGELADVINSGDFDEIQDVAATFQQIESSEAGRLIQEAIDELQEKGYELGGLAGS